MQVVLLNLDRDVAKLRFMTDQFRKLGVLFERVAAVDGKVMAHDARARSVNFFRWWCSVGVSPRDAEIGCAMSHAALYRRLVDGEFGECVCIFEDDVIVSSNICEVLLDVEAWIGNACPRVVLLSDRVGQYKAVKNIGKKFFRSRFGYCTDAYVLNRIAAKALLRENYPLQRPCDHWAKWVKRGAIELYHYVPSVARQDQASFGSSTQNGLVPVSEWPILSWAWFKCGRVIGKFFDLMLG